MGVINVNGFSAKLSFQTRIAEKSLNYFVRILMVRLCSTSKIFSFSQVQPENISNKDEVRQGLL